MIKDNIGITDTPFWTPACESHSRFHQDMLHQVARKMAYRAQYMGEDFCLSQDWVYSPKDDSMVRMPAAIPPVTPIRGRDRGHASKVVMETTYSTVVTSWSGGMLWDFGYVPSSPYDDEIRYIRDTIDTIDYHQYIDDPTTTEHLDFLNWELV